MQIPQIQAQSYNFVHRTKILQELIKKIVGLYLCYMKVTTIKESPLVMIGSFAIVTILTLGAIIPLETPFNKLLSSYAVEMMLAFLTFGMVGYVLRQNAIILTNFAACIILCSFLKDAHTEEFTYATPNEEDIKISVAHLVLNDEESILKFQEDFKNLKADFLSIQTPIEPTLEKKLTQKLKQSLPYSQKTICNNNLALFVFSKYELRNLDTLYCNYTNTVSLAGTMFIDSMHEEISFLSTRVPVGDEEQNQAQKQFASLSNYINKNCQDKPLITFSGSELVSWSPEVRAFRLAHKLADSRMDIGLSAKDEHIFYSKDLMCISFQEILDGNGVLASYQFKKQEITTAQKESAIRHISTQL